MVSHTLLTSLSLAFLVTTTTALPLDERDDGNTTLQDQFVDSVNINSNWTFPSAIDQDFLKKYYINHNGAPTNDSDQVGDTTDLIIEALQNITIPESGNFSSEAVVVHVGDFINVAFRSERIRRKPSRYRYAKRRVEMHCLVCKRGQENGTIYNACNNYTDTDSGDISTFYNTTDLIGSGARITLPDLSDTVSIPNNTVGLCFFTLPQDEEAYTGIDRTMPFAVTQSRRANESEVWYFSSSYPTGRNYEDSLSTMNPGSGSSNGSPSCCSSGRESTAPLAPGAIAGIVIGIVALGIVLIVIVVVNKKSGKSTPVAKRVDTPSGTELAPVAAAVPGGVARRVSGDEHGDVPPSYTQAVADGSRNNVAGGGVDGQTGTGTGHQGAGNTTS